MNVNLLLGSTGSAQGLSNPHFAYAIGGASSPSDFWTVGGGLQIYDVNHTTPPLFQDDVILRGGKVTVHVTIPTSNTDSIACRLFWIRTVPDSVSGQVILGSIGTVPWGWDPSCSPDFDRLVGRVMFTNEAILNPDNHYVSFQVKLPIQKINQVAWLQGGPQTALVVQTVNLTSGADVAVNLAFAWNLSFSGDANGVFTTPLSGLVTPPTKLRVSSTSVRSSPDVKMNVDQKPPRR